MWFKKIREILAAIFTGLIFLYVFPAFISLCRVASSIGSGLFMLPSFITLLGKDKDADYVTWLSWGIVVCSVIVQLATRVPSIFRQFRPKIEDVNAREEMDEAEKQENFGIVAKAVYYVLYILTVVSAFMTVPNNILSAGKLFDFAAKQLKPDVDQNTHGYQNWRMAVSHIIAITAFFNYMSFNVRKGRENARRVASKINAGKVPLKAPATWAAMAIGFPGAVTVACMSRFSTASAVASVMSQYHIESFAWQNQVINVSSYISSTTALVSQVITQFPGIYAFLTSGSQKPNPNLNHWWIGLLRKIVYGAGFYSDGLMYAISNATGVATTLQNNFHIDPKTTTAIVLNALSSTCAAGSYALFSVVEGFEDTLTYMLPPPPTSRDIELQEQRSRLLEGDPEEGNEDYVASYEDDGNMKRIGKGNVPVLQNIPRYVNYDSELRDHPLAAHSLFAHQTETTDPLLDTFRLMLSQE